MATPLFESFLKKFNRIFKYKFTRIVVIAFDENDNMSLQYENINHWQWALMTIKCQDMATKTLNNLDDKK